MSIRVILSTGSLWLMDTAYSFDLAAEAGFDGMEIMCDDRYTTRDRRYLEKLSADFGLPIPVLHTPFTSNLLGWGHADTELGKVRHTLELAEKLNAESIVVHLPLRYSRATLKLGNLSLHAPWFSAHDRFRAWMASGGLSQLQSETKVQIAIENMPVKSLMGEKINPAWWNTVDEWSTIHAHLTLDTTHWATFGIDPLVPLHKAGDRVKHIHLSNYEAGREHRLPQSGEVDLAAFLRELATMNFTGTVSVELHPDALAFDNTRATRRKLRETLDFCREHLG